MKTKEEIVYQLSGLDMFRTIHITDDLINEVKLSITGYNSNEFEIEYLIIISSANLFLNYELEYFVTRFNRNFETKICLELFLTINDLLINKYTDLINNYRKLSVINSFYKNSVGYHVFEDNYETVEYVKTINGKEVVTKRLELKKSTKKHVPADKELLKQLVKKYGVLEGNTITNIEDMLVDLIKNNKVE